MRKRVSREGAAGDYEGHREYTVVRCTLRNCSGLRVVYRAPCYPSNMLSECASDLFAFSAKLSYDFSFVELFVGCCSRSDLMVRRNQRYAMFMLP